MYLREDGRPPTSSQFTLRVAILGGIALAMFSIVFFRLWYLSVLSGDDYRREAENNQLRTIRVQAPRGEILDRNGKVLVDNRTALALQVEPQNLPGHKRERAHELARLGRAAGMPLARIRQEMKKQRKELPSSPVILKRQISYPLVYYLQENQESFPGVSVQKVFVRNYPHGSLAAQVFGYVGQVTAEQLKEPRYQDLEPGDSVGQTGVEYQYDSLLRGRPGTTKVNVDARGRPRGSPLSDQQATPGDDLRLSLDENVQSAGEAALSSFGGLPGAFAVMNVHNGQVLGLGSYPTFDPSLFTRPNLPPSLFKRLSAEKNGSPLSDRAIQGLYPTGSTFKPITALGVLDDGLITPSTPIYDPGSVQVDTVTFKNSGGGQGFGTLTLPDALRVSSDVFFYKLGLKADAAKDEPIQQAARELGLGSATGIDLPAEVQGLVPTPEWRNKLYKDGQTDRPWTAGDSVNLAVGQGDLQADPLQMAVAYAAIGNGGDVLRPHLAERVEDSSGRVVQEIRPAPWRHIDIDPTYRRAIMDGMHGGAQEPGGTSFKVFGNFPVDIAGKTGTAERGLFKQDQSWYVALAPYPNPKYVVATTIEEGGFGADAAAPAARGILTALLGKQATSGGSASGAPTTPAPAASTGGGSYD
jgi:penicillin-binding protein 2